MEVVRRLLLRAIGAYESREGKGPTVRELAADLGLPDDFGHEHLVDHLQQGVAAGQVAHDQGRFTLTGAGRLALAADVAPRPAPLEPSLLP